MGMEDFPETLKVKSEGEKKSLDEWIEQEMKSSYVNKISEFIFLLARKKKEVQMKSIEESFDFKMDDLKNDDLVKKISEINNLVSDLNDLVSSLNWSLEISGSEEPLTKKEKDIFKCVNKIIEITRTNLKRKMIDFVKDNYLKIYRETKKRREEKEKIEAKIENDAIKIINEVQEIILNPDSDFGKELKISTLGEKCDFNESEIINKELESRVKIINNSLDKIRELVNQFVKKTNEASRKEIREELLKEVEGFIELVGGEEKDMIKFVTNLKSLENRKSDE